MKPHLLVVEDEAAHRLIIEKALASHYTLTMASSFNEGLHVIKEGKFDGFLFDIMLGDGNGFDLLAEARKIKALRHKPIIFLTSRTEVSSKVLGFNLGADDYIVKPCNPEELRVRIDSKIKKFKDMAEHPVDIIYGPLLFNFEMQVVTDNETGKKLDLTPLEFKLLYFLASHNEEAQTREEILEAVWGNSTNVSDRSVDTYVASLRKKLGEHSKVIKSVHGVGYSYQAVSSTQKSQVS
ncbi:MAG: response regulator transcription factor [Bdellovibrionales bacterium]|nr:response regulator transcription factor [Bdellovibrionales bacterium]